MVYLDAIKHHFTAMPITKSQSWVLIFAAVFTWSAIAPKDYFTWILEVLPALFAAAVLGFTRKSFPLTPLAYILILIHAVILMVGGHYTYAEVPFFDWLAELFDWNRNNYDKVGHLAQGFIPAMFIREILLRKQVVQSGGWLNFLVAATALGISAAYELLEWGVAEATGEDAEAFLGTQGYVWDTQSDMGLALLGAILAQVVFNRFHNKQLQPFLASKP